jgi:Ino eighty subunit 2
MDTINRLLKKQPPKRRGRAAADVGESGQEDEPEVEKASPVFVRHIQNVNGSRIAVPEEWLSSPIGDVFTHTIPASGSALRRFSGRMVEEVA